MDQKDGFSAIKKVESHDSASSSTSSRRRFSGGSNWFKKLQHKFSGNGSSEGSSAQSSRKNSVSSLNGTADDGYEPVHVARKLSLRRRKSSFSSNAPETDQGGSSSNSKGGAKSGAKGGENDTARWVGATGGSASGGPLGGGTGTGTGTGVGAGVGAGTKAGAGAGAGSGATGRGASPAAGSTGSADSGAGRPSMEKSHRRKVTTKGVGFSLSTFVDNPPQRIPPSKPESGNIEFGENGEVRIFRRNKHGQREAVRVIRNHSDTVRAASQKAVQSASRLMNTVNGGAGAGANAGANTGAGSAGAGPAGAGGGGGGGASGLPVFSFFGRHSAMNAAAMGSSETPAGAADEDEPAVREDMAKLDVDGTSKVQMSYTEHHESGAAGAGAAGDGAGAAGAGAGTESFELREISDEALVPPPDQVYIRCCHLREIMPIRNILKQLQGQVAPIPRLRIANTKPTLVEIQAFSDFLSVVPVAALIVDNHILTDEMVKLVMVALARSKDLCRLTLVNTRLSAVGWQYLCAYLGSKGGRLLLALNLACTSPTDVPSRVPAFDRSDMDWDLFVDALQASGTLEELDLGGTQIPAAKIAPLLSVGFQKSGQILSLANNALSHAEVKFVADWAQQNDTHLMGINLSGNNLSRQEDRGVLQQLLTNTKLIQLSMRNANFTASDASHMIKAITPEQASLSNLRQLDLSCNPGLFPDVADRLYHLLPKFPNLARLQFEQCNLSSDIIIALCESLSHCHRLVYLNLLKNQPLNQTASTALCVAVHLSRSICTVEADLEGADPALRQQLARYCFQNLEKNTGALTDQSLGAAGDDEENADITSFYDDLVAVRKQLSSITATATPELVKRTDDLREEINKRLQSILTRRKVAPPTTRDRVSAIRLLFYASSLDKLKKEITATSANAKSNTLAVPGEEMVKNVDETDIKPPLKRQASQASIISLKKLEREEGESHKALSNILDMDDDQMLDAMRNLKVQDLESLMP